MPPNMQFVTPASAIEAVLRLKGFIVVPKGKDLHVSLPRMPRKLTLNTSSNVASFSKTNYQRLKGTTPDEIADELMAILTSGG
jgi:hypothetical protein